MLAKLLAHVVHTTYSPYMYLPHGLELALAKDC